MWSEPVDWKLLYLWLSILRVCRRPGLCGINRLDLRTLHDSRSLDGVEQIVLFLFGKAYSARGEVGTHGGVVCAAAGVIASPPK
jgi:hypothetical protein